MTYPATVLIAYNAGPLIDRYVRSGSCLRITGGDGLPLVKDGYVWDSYVQGWLKRGVKIHYLLFDESEKAMEKLHTLRVEYGADAFSVHCIDWPRVEAADRAQLDTMKTCHFLVGAAPKLLWIELEHLPGMVLANNCEFVPPSVAEHDPRYKELEGVFDNAVAKYGRLINVAPELVPLLQGHSSPPVLSKGISNEQ